MIYHVSIAVDGRYNVDVDNAGSPEDAKMKAISIFAQTAELGNLECINTTPVNAEDECGRLTDF